MSLSFIRKHKSLLLFFTLLYSFLFFSADVVHAQQDTDLGVNEVNETIALGSRSLYEIIGTIINTFLGLLGIIALVMMVYGGYKIMTSGGNEERVQEGKRTLINATIGLAIILASFAITNFVINALREATTTGGPGGPGQRAGAPSFQSFSGSGALGDAVKNHYPGRGETGVKRNAKITVTFNYPIAPSTIIENTNDTCWTPQGDSTTTPNTNPSSVCEMSNGSPIPYYGDCLEDGGADGSFQWEDDCDQIRTSSVRIAKSTSTDPNQVDLMGATGMISYEFEGGTSRENAQARTFVFKTNDLLGSNLEKTRHTVELTDDIKREKTDNQGQNLDLFTGAVSNYEWGFETDTNFDFDPPTVVGVYPPERSPNNLEQVHKNSILQINFSEPMDPTAVQGTVTSSPSSFTNIIFGTSTMQSDFGGEWRITNGYKTVEFIPSNECGTNSCGDPMYCLNINCPQGQKSCSDQLTTLIRTAELVNQNASWEAKPFSGVMDMAGNALDGNANANREGKPSNNDPNIDVWEGFSSNEKNADNFFWSYEVLNKIDRRIPYIQTINPRVDEDNIAGETPLQLSFSMPMQYSSFDGINLEEYSTSTANSNNRPQIPGTNETLDPIWFYVDAINTTTGVYINNSNTTGTVATIEHREFGPNDMDLFYTTSVSTSVKGINQNCVYPGLGPDKNSSKCKAQRNSNGGFKSGFPKGCVDVKMESDKDAGCPYNFAQTSGQAVTSSLGACKRKLKNQTTNF